MGDEARAQLAAALDDALPQTQCRQCGYAACRPYAEAISRGKARTNQCPPGGDEGARRLASIAGVAYEPVDERFGITKPPAVAVIDEAACIGCTLCIVACPVDAIVETRIHEYHMENRGENIMSKDKLLAVGDRYEALITADKTADAPYR